MASHPVLFLPMQAILLPLLTLVHAVAVDTVPVAAAADTLAADTAVVELPAPEDTFLDAGAEALLGAVRVGMARTEREITAYRVEGRERFSAHARTPGRERLLFRIETAARVSWRRGEVAEVEPLGARMVAPMVDERVRAVPDATHSLVFDPSMSQEALRIPWSSETLRHPLAERAEIEYRYETGEVSDIRLASGRLVRVRELRVHPRRIEWGLVLGSFWIDIDQGAVVRAVMRPARPFRVSLDADLREDEEGEQTGSVTIASGGEGQGRRLPFGIDPTAEIRTITMEADLWHDRWWLPRLFIAEGSAAVAGFLTVPARWERVYGVYSIEAAPADTAAAAVAQPAAAETLRDECPKDRPDGVDCMCQFRVCTLVRTTEITDTSALITSAALPSSIFAEGESLLSREEWRAVEDAVRGLPGLDIRAPVEARLVTPWNDLSLLRYNRAEGVSAGLAVRARALETDAELAARVSAAGASPSAALSFRRELPAAVLRLRLASELADVDPAGRGLMLGNSLNALLFGRDDGEYYRRTTAAVAIAPPAARRRLWEARVYVERQGPVEQRTGFSLADWQGGGFRPVVAAAPADQAGAGLTLHGVHAIGHALRIGTTASLDGELGTFDFGRAVLGVQARGPMIGGASWALETSAGSSAGDVPPQRGWFLGGPHTLRGYPGSIAAGDAFARTRLEVARGLPAARVALFGDAGWAGARRDLFSADPLVSIGAGASFLDGLVRFDVARALRPPTGWRVDFYLDGAL